MADDDFDLHEQMHQWRMACEALLRQEGSGGEWPSDLPFSLARKVLALIDLVETNGLIPITAQQEWEASQRVLGAMVSTRLLPDLSEESEQIARNITFVALAGIRG